MHFNRVEADLTFDGDILTQAVMAKGSQERPLWKKLETLKPAEMILWVDRFDSLCAIPSEWALAQALEQSMELKVPKRSEFVRTILSEINRLIWLTTFLGRITGTLAHKTLTQQIFVLREQVLVTQEELTGGRILPQALALGGTRRELALGDVQKVRQFIQGWRFIWETWVDVVVGDPLFEARLRGLLPIDRQLIEKWAWWGVVGKASGVDYDARKHRPHGAYMHVDFKVACRQGGDALARVQVAIEEINISLGLIESLLSAIPGSLESRPEPKDLKPGIFYGHADSAKGPVIAALEVSGETQSGPVAHTIRLFSTGQRVWHQVDQIICGIRAEDFQLAFASLGLDSEESEI